MNLIDLLAIGLPFMLFVNWAAFTICFVAARRHKGIRTLVDRRWVSFGIALASTALGFLAVSYYGRLQLGPETNALLLTGPVYFLTGVNLIFLWLTWKERW